MFVPTVRKIEMSFQHIGSIPNKFHLNALLIEMSRVRNKEDF